MEDGGLVVKQYNFTLASLPSFSYTAFPPYFSNPVLLYRDCNAWKNNLCWSNSSSAVSSDVGTNDFLLD